MTTPGGGGTTIGGGTRGGGGGGTRGGGGGPGTGGGGGGGIGGRANVRSGSTNIADKHRMTTHESSFFISTSSNGHRVFGCCSCTWTSNTPCRDD